MPKRKKTKEPKPMDPKEIIEKLEDGESEDPEGKKPPVIKFPREISPGGRHGGCDIIPTRRF